MEVNIKSIAQKAEVSPSTVSRVLGGYPGVREKTRKKVLKVVKESNYEVNAIARHLRQRKTYSIGVVVSNVLSPFYSVIAKSIEDVASKAGYSVILCNGDENPEKELKYLRVLISKRVDGIILVPTGYNANYIKWLIDSGNKIILLDRMIKGISCDSVIVDNEIGAYKATEHLIEQSYRKIALIDGYPNRTTGEERMKGYLNALQKAGIRKDDDIIKFGDFKKESGIKLTKQLLCLKKRPEAIFTANLDMTLGAVIAIKEMGLKIPDEIGIIGFDDSDWAAIMDPPLSVVSQPTYSLGSTAAELLLKKIKGESFKHNRSSHIVRLNTSLIIRNSTRKIVNVV